MLLLVVGQGVVLVIVNIEPDAEPALLPRPAAEPALRRLLQRAAALREAPSSRGAAALEWRTSSLALAFVLLWTVAPLLPFGAARLEEA